MCALSSWLSDTDLAERDPILEHHACCADDNQTDQGGNALESVMDPRDYHDSFMVRTL